MIQSKIQRLLKNDFNIREFSMIKKDLERYVKRNTLTGNLYCPQCLKAHIIKTAKENGVINKKIQTIIPGEIGHDGYYLDGESLIRLT